MRYLQKYQVFKTSSIPGENYPELKKKLGRMLKAIYHWKQRKWLVWRSDRSPIYFILSEHK